MKRRPSPPGVYTQEFEDRVVQRYLSGTESSTEVAAVEGINAGTLRQWAQRRQADTGRRTSLLPSPSMNVLPRKSYGYCWPPRRCPTRSIELVLRTGLRPVTDRVHLE